MVDKGKPPSDKQVRFEQSLYCGDPNCVHCKEIREMQDYIRSSSFTLGHKHFPKPKADRTRKKSTITMRQADFHSDLKPNKRTPNKEESE